MHEWCAGTGEVIYVVFVGPGVYVRWCVWYVCQEMTHMRGQADQGSQASLFLPVQEPVPPSPSKPDCGGEWYVLESASLFA